MHSALVPCSDARISVSSWSSLIAGITTQTRAVSCQFWTIFLSNRIVPDTSSAGGMNLAVAVLVVLCM
jgi:hypothetical protein